MALAVAGGLTGSGVSASPLGVATGGITADHLAGPARIYSRLMTPRWLQSNADFHSARVSTITDTGVSFGAAGTGNIYTRLLTVPLLPANTLKPHQTYLMRMVINQVPASADNDPTFGLTDGTNFVGLTKADADNAFPANVTMGLYGNNLSVNTSTVLDGPGQNAQNFEFLLQLAPATGGNTQVFFVSRVGMLAGRHQAFSAIDLTRALSFTVFANDPPESYTFESFEVTIDREG